MKKLGLITSSITFVISFILSLVVITTSSLTSAMGRDPLTPLYKEVERLGYIHHQTSLQYAGIGTLVGGSPENLSLIAAPQICFPQVVQGEAAALRTIDEASLPPKTYKYRFSGDSRFDLINFLKVGNPILDEGTNFRMMHTIELVMEGLFVEYMDISKLEELYFNVPDMCKNYLNMVGFVIQALKVEKMTLNFYNAAGAKIFITLENLGEIVKINPNVDFFIDENSSLTITTPKVVGHQMGRLRMHDDGVALYIANKARLNKFVFKPWAIFNEEESPSDHNHRIHSSFFSEEPELPDLTEKELVDLSAIYEE